MITNSMMGLGDNIYQRAFIALIEETVWLNTPWPDIYMGLPHVRFTPPNESLRTQRKNIRRQPAMRFEKIRSEPSFKVRYRDEGPIEGMSKVFNLPRPSELRLPGFPRPFTREPYAVVRPNTLRREWYAASRNCRPKYICEAAEELFDRGIRVISVADLEEGEEWLEDDILPLATERYHHGELRVDELLGLVRGASLVVGSPGWIVPAALAYKTPAWIIAGGQGGFNSPDRIAPEPYRSQAGMEFAVPDNYCYCKEKRHDCDKRITDHLGQFRVYLESRVGAWFPSAAAD